MHYQNRKHFLILFFLALPVFLFSQNQVWQREYIDFQNGADEIAELPNGDLVFIDNAQVRVIDSAGGIRWTLQLANATTNTLSPISMDVNSAGEIILLARASQTAEYLVRLSAQGQVLAENLLPVDVTFPVHFSAVPSGGSFFVQNNSTNQEYNVVRLDSQGDTIWTRNISTAFPLNISVEEATITQDGGFVVTGDYGDLTVSGHLYCRKFDGNGNDVWEKTFAPPQWVPVSTGLDLVEAPNSSLRVLHMHDILGPLDSYWIMELSPAGDSLNSYQVIDMEFPKIIANPGGGFVMYPRRNLPSSIEGLVLAGYDWSGSTTWFRSNTMPGRSVALNEVIATQFNGFAGAGESYNQNITPFTSGGYIARTDSTGLNFANRIYGVAYYDLNANCQQDPGEPEVPSQTLQITGDSTFFFSTDPQGSIVQSLPAGNYQLQPDPGNSYWGAPNCFSPINIAFLGTGDSLLVEIPLTPGISCPQMQVDISSFALPVCFASWFHVSWANIGTDSAYGAYVDVELPPSVTLDSTSIPIGSTLPNNIYRFQLGDVASLQQGDFRLHVTVDCPGNPLDLLGRTECAIARIYPDTNCHPLSPIWDGSKVEVFAECLPTDSVRLVIRNVSSNPMTAPGSYLVLEDNIMRINSTFQLPANDSLEIRQDGRGSTWTLIADQSPGHPGSSNPLVSIEGCGTNNIGQITLGVLPQMPQDDNDPHISIHCATYVGSYDPNDKLAFPIGFGPDHSIEPDIEIEYLIRFQNTGTFPAQRVVLLDTVDTGLDLSSLRVLGASHNYNWQLHPNRELFVEFPAIMLPDSATDEPNSHGFFKFALTPVSSAMPGQRIENRAAIYFDYNPPIITNRVFHTIADDMFVVAIEEAFGADALALEVFPNPFREVARFRVQESLGQNAHFELRNLQGQLVMQLAPGDVREFEIQPGNLPAGIYLFHLQDSQGRTASGKMIRHR